jgi:DNA-binding CsgD family transcriptional regulator
MIFFDEKHSDNKRLSLWAVALCSLIFVLIGLDISGDYKDGIARAHIVIELLILLISLSGIAFFGWLYFQATQFKINLLKQDLAIASQQALEWREKNRDLIAGLSQEIDKQFKAWALTQAEAEVGMLMLKGLSHQEIADVRNSSERTIRDQARAVYRKSGVSGRSELSAFFLEDLLLPRISLVSVQ